MRIRKMCSVQSCMGSLSPVDSGESCSFCGAALVPFADFSENLSPREMSLEARASIEPAAARLKALVFRMIEKAGDRGMTCDEIEAQAGLTHQTASARVNELMRARKIVACGRRLTRSGRRAITWRVATVAEATRSEAS